MMRVFYDGKCGLCSREINYYRRIAPQNIFEWIDITVQPTALLQLGISIQDGLKSLHVQYNAEQFHQGVDGFLLIWEHIPHFRWLSRIIRLKLFYLIATFLYAKFVAWHFTRMGYHKCAI